MSPPVVTPPSAWTQTDNNGSNTFSGTLTAAPHATGLTPALVAKDPASHRSPALITATITIVVTNNKRLLPPVPTGTATLIAYNGH